LHFGWAIIMNIKKIGAGVAAFFILFTLWLSAYRVQEYERAVLTRFGEYKEVVGPGLHWKLPYIDSATFFQISIQEIIQSKVNTYTVDNQQLDARIVVFYRIPAASIEYIYKSVPDLSARLRALSIDRFKSEMGKMNITQVAQKRGLVRDTIKDVLSATAKDILHVDVTDFQIPNIDYTPGFRRAVEQAAIAKTLVEKAEQEKREKTVQAETAKIEALGKANAAREDAKGKADAIRFNAEATAAQIRLEGEAKAEAIQKQAKALGNNPLLVEYRKAEQWKGDVPQWTGGGGLPVINLSPPGKK
ncbi:MAG: SPFH domain-containing protein, partial [Alphaproteobacteria bacterium]|nr:SPFH domain-containing protein [Alphaproteobacteria bacterium]